MSTQLKNPISYGLRYNVSTKIEHVLRQKTKNNNNNEKAYYTSQENWESIVVNISKF